jgi:diacylglycerol kinase (ATP)|tara:strand:- start:444 stop:896 length:453 start_codon:yes stop_codon:yes gene_type:complete
MTQPQPPALFLLSDQFLGGSSMDKQDSQSARSVPPSEKGVARLVSATVYSLAGLKAAIKHEEAFRLELIAFIVLTPIALWLGESDLEKVLLITSLVLVILVELVNSAIEAVVDRSGLEYNELSGRAKDIGSAAVFVSLLFVVFVWAMLLL